MQYLIALCLLPYLKVTPLNSDTQPHAFLAVIAALSIPVFIRAKLPLYPLTLACAFLFFFVGVLSGEVVQGISAAMLPIGIDFISRQSERRIVQGVKIAIVVLLIGIVLNVVAEGILTSLVSNFRSGGSRGINSFASEASFLGLLGIACFVILHFLNESWYWRGLSALVIIVSGSATAIVPFFLFLVLIYVRGWKLLLLPVLVAVIVVGFQYTAETDTRIGNIARAVSKSPELIFLDVSFSNRVIRSAGPLVESYKNGFIPQGFSAEFEAGITGLSGRSDLSVERLSNPASVLIYGLGFLSLPIIGLYLSKSKGPIELWYIIIFFSTVNISTATPYLWIIYAIPWILKRRERISRYDGSPSMLSPNGADGGRAKASGDDRRGPTGLRFPRPSAWLGRKATL